VDLLYSPGWILLRSSCFYNLSTLCLKVHFMVLIMKFQNWSTIFHLGCNCNEPIIRVFEILRISIVIFGTSYVCIRRKLDNFNC
jgi:hypothetical protein